MVNHIDVLAADFLADMGNLIRTNSGARITQYFRAEVEDLRVSEQTGVCWGAVAILLSTNHLLVFLHGVWGQGSSVRLCEGYFYTQQQVAEVSAGFNYEVARTARDVFNNLVRPVVNQRTHLSVFGHSAGGAVAEALARIYYQEVNRRYGSVTTYGAPKAGLPGSCLTLLQTYRTRYMAVDDPVPFIPMGGTFIGGLAVLQGGPRNNIVPLVVHGERGILLARSSVRARQDGEVRDDAAGAINGWILGQRPWTTYHSMDFYAALLRQHDPGEINELNPARGHQMEEPPLPQVAQLGFLTPPIYYLPEALTPAPSVVLPIQFVTIREQFVKLANGESILARRTRGNEMPQGRIRTALAWTFAPAAQGGFFIFWNDFLVGKTTSRSAARTVCRSANRLLRLMGNRAQWYSTALSDAWPSFLTIAASGNGQYVPPLNVVP